MFMDDQLKYRIKGWIFQPANDYGTFDNLNDALEEKMRLKLANPQNQYRVVILDENGKEVM